MPESPDTATESAAPADSRYLDGGRRDRRLYRTLAWVGITAGVVFIVAVIFFAGLALGRVTGGNHSWHRGYQGGQMAPGGCPMMGTGGMGGAMMGPGQMGPGQMGPGRMSPGQPSTPAGPSPTQR